MALDWKTMSSSVTVVKGEQRYGLVHRGEKTHIRNYHRTLKKGGMTLVDLIEAKIEIDRQHTLEMLTKRIYGRTHAPLPI